MPAPLLIVSARQKGREAAILKLSDALPARGFWTSAMPKGFSNKVQFLGSGETAGILQPGEYKRVPIQYAGWKKPWDFSYPPITFKISTVHSSNEKIIDWSSVKLEMKPENLNEEKWNVLWNNFVFKSGSTWGDYVTMLSNNSIYLSKLGLNITEVKEILSFEFAKANGMNVIRNLCPFGKHVLTFVPLIKFHQNFHSHLIFTFPVSLREFIQKS